MMKSIFIILITIYLLLGCDSQNEKVPVEIEFTESDFNYFKTLGASELKLIDSTVYSHTHERWRKIALVVGKSFELQEQFPELDETKLLLGVHHLINQNKLVSQGNIKAMRFSEVKRK